MGPFVAIWYVLFMVPFFLWVREPKRPGAIGMREAARGAWPGLIATLKGLPRQRSLFAFLGASMFYRDALNGIYAFGGLFAAGVLGWSVTQVGVFGILAALTGAVFAWVGGRADSRFGPRPVIATCVLVLTGLRSPSCSSRASGSSASRLGRTAACPIWPSMCWARSSALRAGRCNRPAGR